MPLTLVTATFEAATNLPEDAIVNTWHWRNDPAIVDPENVFDMLEDFYTATPAGESVPLSTYFSDKAFSGECHLRMYDLGDPQPRAVLHETQFSFTPSSTDTLPYDVAVVLSLSAEGESGVPQARRRNRKYIGPLTTPANDDGQVHQNFIDVLAAAARDMLEAAIASVNWSWVIYSPTAADDAPVVSGWVDNEFDTQRRRGRDATSRTLWSDGVPVVP